MYAMITCRMTALRSCGFWLHSAPAKTAPALRAVRAVKVGRDTPKRWRVWMQEARSSTPLCFCSKDPDLCQARPHSPPPLDRQQHKHRSGCIQNPETWVLCKHGFVLLKCCIQYSVPYVAVGQSPAVLQQQSLLRTKCHVEVYTISSIYMQKQWSFTQLS